MTDELEIARCAGYLVFLFQPALNAQLLFALWPDHAGLAEYPIPDLPTLTVWFEEYVSWRNDMLYRDQYKAVKTREPM